jgi:hypothetical protein
MYNMYNVGNIMYLMYINTAGNIYFTTIIAIFLFSSK